jgi:hypothetical protein
MLVVSITDKCLGSYLLLYFSGFVIMFFLFYYNLGVWLHAAACFPALSYTPPPLESDRLIDSNDL